MREVGRGLRREEGGGLYFDRSLLLNVVVFVVSPLLPSLNHLTVALFSSSSQVVC